MATFAFFLILMSALIHATWNLAAKRVSGNTSVLAIAQGIGALVAIPTAIPVWNTAQVVATFPHAIASCVIQIIYFLIMSAAYKIGELSVVYPVTRGTAVLGSAILGYFVMHDSFTPFGICGIAIVLFGILALSQFTHRRSSIAKSALLAMSLGVSSSVCGVVDKWAVEKADPRLYMCFMMILCAMVFVPYMFFKQREQFREALRVHKMTAFVIGLGLTYGYMLVLFAFQLGSLSYVIAMREVSVVIGALFGVVIFKEKVNPRKATGIIAILTGLIFLKLA